MNYLKFIKKTKLILMGILIFLSSFNGVLLSGIIVYAGSLNQTSSFSDVLRFGAISILGWSAIYISNYYLEVTEASIIKDINVKIKQGYFREQYLSSEMVKDYSSIISVLSIPIRGLNTGILSIEAFVQVRPPIVWDATCPKLSPVISA